LSFGNFLNKHVFRNKRARDKINSKQGEITKRSFSNIVKD
jgi:hypothetical protein